MQIVNQLCDKIVERSKKGKDYGIVLVKLIILN